MKVWAIYKTEQSYSKQRQTLRTMLNQRKRVFVRAVDTHTVIHHVRRQVS